MTHQFFGTPTIDGHPRTKQGLQKLRQHSSCLAKISSSLIGGHLHCVLAFKWFRKRNTEQSNEFGEN